MTQTVNGPTVQSPTATPADDTRWREALLELWKRQHQWSSKADELKSAHWSRRPPLVVAGLIGVVLSTVSEGLARWVDGVFPDSGDWPRRLVVLSGPLLVGLTGLFVRELLGPKSEQLWLKARMVSENLKTEGYTYAVGVPPYDNADDAPERLSDKAREIAQVPDITSLPARPSVVEKRPLEPIDVAGYIQYRVDPQIEHHAKGARKYDASLARWRRVGIGLAAASIVLGLLATAFNSAAINTWVGLISTGIATLTTFVYASRLEFLAASYFVTTQKLEGLVQAWRVKRDQGPEARVRFIVDCEATLAAQNRSWSDELSKAIATKPKLPDAASTNGAPPASSP